jgi:hypothetical protein
MGEEPCPTWEVDLPPKGDVSNPYFKNGSSGPMGMIRVGLMVGWLQ